MISFLFLNRVMLYMIIGMQIIGWPALTVPGNIPSGGRYTTVLSSSTKETRGTRTYLKSTWCELLTSDMGIIMNM